MMITQQCTDNKTIICPSCCVAAAAQSQRRDLDLYCSCLCVRVCTDNETMSEPEYTRSTILCSCTHVYIKRTHCATWSHWTRLLYHIFQLLAEGRVTMTFSVPSANRVLKEISSTRPYMFSNSLKPTGHVYYHFLCRVSWNLVKNDGSPRSE